MNSQENSEFPPIKPRLKIDAVLYPAGVLGFGKYWTTPPQIDYDMKSILKPSKAMLNLVFRFSYTGCQMKIRDSYYLSIRWGRTDLSMPFLWTLKQSRRGFERKVMNPLLCR